MQLQFHVERLADVLDTLDDRPETPGLVVLLLADEPAVEPLFEVLYPERALAAASDERIPARIRYRRPPRPMRDDDLKLLPTD